MVKEVTKIISENIDELRVDDFVYLHHKSNQEISYFGRYKGIDAKKETLIFRDGLHFGFDKGYNLWFPIKSFQGCETSKFTKKAILEKYVGIYVNDEIDDGLSKNDNYNHSLVKKIKSMI